MFVADIGEFELIAHLESSIRARNAAQVERLRSRGVRVDLGIGDDAAAWSYPRGVVVATTDAMVENVHFTPATTPWRRLGWKALASNLSDVGAMGCAPTFALVTLGLRADLPVAGLTEMYDGMMDALEYSGGALVGGDVVHSETFFVSVSLEGLSAPDGATLRRDAARPGDVIGVTGHLGCSAAGLRLLLDTDGRSGARLESATRDHLVAAHNRPLPRVAEGAALARAGVRCAMDVSDGLAADLAKLCAASGVSARIEASRLPADPHLRAAFPREWMRLALTGGEDYELVFTAPAETMDEAKLELGEGAGGITVIGEISDGFGGSGVAVIDADGGEVMLDSGGWDHFNQ